MIYMVEMNLIDLSGRPDWDNWYLEHTKMLLTFPGFHATQRFECIHETQAPFVALHHVDGIDFFNSYSYKNKAGPSGTGVWRNKMNNWNRNLFDGLETTPNVKEKELLVLIEDEVTVRLDEKLEVHWLTSVGLDMNVKRRGLAVTSLSKSSQISTDTPGVRVLRPIFNRLTKDDL
ncbi:MAG: hypothetical protein ACJZ2I_01670 [Thalassobaculaceae bacterium]